MMTEVNGEMIADRASDLRTPLPRGEGADAPQGEAQEGSVALAYTEQNFNELVAANTAMTGEISNLNVMLGTRDSEIAHLREVISESLQPSIAALSRNSNAMESTISGLETEMKREEEEHAFTKAKLAAAERRLERSKGYIDRMLDDEARLGDQPKEVRPLPRDPVGPNLRDILDPAPPRRSSDRPDYLGGVAMLGEAYSDREQRRRY